jgi:hypothetical protein
MNIWYIHLVAAVPPTIAALAALIVALKTKAKVADVHLSINSRMDELVAAAKAQGRQDERDSRKKAK